MKLRDLWSQVGMMLGDPEFQKVNQNEITMDLNMAQKALSRTLIDVDREQMMYWTLIPGVIDQIEYDIPMNVDEIQRVSYAGKECQRISVRDIGVLEVESRNTMMRGSKQFQQYYYLIQGVGGRPKIGIYPIPDDTSNISVYYVARVIDLSPYGSHNGVVTAVTSTTVFTDTGLPLHSLIADFWINGEIFWKSDGGTGANRTGVVSRVVSNTETGIITLVDAMPSAPEVGDTYEIDQVSIIPDQHHDMMAFYAAAQGMVRTQRDPRAYLSMYQDGVASIRRRWTSDIEATAVGEQPAEIRS